MPENAMVVAQPTTQQIQPYADKDSYELALRMSKSLASSTLVPPEFQGERGQANCVIAMEMAGRVGISPFMCIQNLYVVNGRPSWSSQFLIALINTSGQFKGKLKYEYSPDKTSCRAYAVDKDTGETLEGPEISLKMAQNAGWKSPAWKTMPEQMLAYRAAAFFARRYCPELAMGLHTKEEYIDVDEEDGGLTRPAPMSKEEKKKKGRELSASILGEEPAPVIDAKLTPDTDTKVEPVPEPEPAIPVPETGETKSGGKSEPPVHDDPEPELAHPTAARRMLNRYKDFFGGNIAATKSAMDAVTGGRPSSEWTAVILVKLEKRLVEMERECAAATDAARDAGGNVPAADVSEELLTQAVRKIRLVDPAMNAGILRAEDSTGLYTDICVASVQTAVKQKRLDALKERGIRLCVVDEAHHAAAGSYVKILENLGFLHGDDPEKLLVGVTATAYRGDGIALGEVFEKVTFERTILSMMKAGYLCDARGVSVKTGTDLSGVHTARGDFDLGELSDVIDIPARNKLITETYLRECPGRKAVVFCVGVEHAKNVSEAFRDVGVASLPIYGEMERMERFTALTAYEKGDVRVLTNCAVLTEGWDDPATSVVMMARPTKSRSLWVQCVGRGLRTYPGKRDCLVVDFADTAGRHNLCGIATLAGDPRVKPKPKQTILDAFEEFEEFEAGREEWKHARVGEVSREEFDIMGRSDFVWTPVQGGHFRLPVSAGQSLWVRREPGGYMVWLLNCGDFAANKTALSDDPLPLGYAQGVAEDYIRLHGARHLVSKEAAWRKKSPTERQLETLKKLGIPHNPAGISSGEASSLIDLELARREAARDEPASHKQLWFIRHKLGAGGVRPGLTKGEASRIISEAKKRQEVA